MKLNRDNMVDTLETLVNIDSGSHDKEGVDRLGQYLSDQFSSCGFTTKVFERESIGNHLLLTHEQATSPKIIILAHLDTVFPKGTALSRPFTTDATRAYGPGVIDMKASHVMLLYAVKSLAGQSDASILNNIQILLNSDEEIGSTDSRSIIEQYAADKDYALVLEPARADGSIVSARRGTGKFYFNVTGKASHSGMAPEKGINANTELAYQVIEIENISNPEEDLHVNVVKMEGGVATNIIPEHANATIDVRISNDAQGEYVADALQTLASNPKLDGSVIEVTGEITRPPMEYTEDTSTIVDVIKTEATELSIDIDDTTGGGGSDASFPAAKGVVTIDGLGPIGGNQHQEDEYLELDSLVERTQLFINVLKRLTKDALLP